MPLLGFSISTVLQVRAQRFDQSVEVLCVAMRACYIDTDLQCRLNSNQGTAVLDLLNDNREVFSPRKQRHPCTCRDAADNPILEFQLESDTGYYGNYRIEDVVV